MTTLVATVTADVVTLNCPVDAPEAIVMDEGTVAEGSDDFKFTIAPPVPATELKVTVPVTTVVLPPSIAAGATVTDFTPAPLFPILATNAEKIIGPHPVSVSQPGPADEVLPFGKTPFVPEVTSKNIVGSPLNE